MLIPSSEKRALLLKVHHLRTPLFYSSRRTLPKSTITLPAQPIEAPMLAECEVVGDFGQFHHSFKRIRKPNQNTASASAKMTKSIIPTIPHPQTCTKD